MEITNHIIVSMLKKQLLDIYEKYSNNPELTKDPMVGLAYDKLVSVSSVNDFLCWQQTVQDLDLGFDNVNGIARQGNLLGRLDDIAAGADNSAIAELVAWKRNFTPENSDAARYINRRTVEEIVAAVSTGYDAHIVLFKCNGQWAAIGNDADRLFEIFGWQTGYVNDDDKWYSFMFVNKYGLKVLEESEYKVEVLDLGKRDIVSLAFNEDLVSAMQQYIDFVRNFANSVEAMHMALVKDIPFIFDNSGINEQDVVEGYKIVDGRVEVRLRSGKDVTLVDGNSWRLDRLGEQLLLSYPKDM